MPEIGTERWTQKSRELLLAIIWCFGKNLWVHCILHHCLFRQWRITSQRKVFLNEIMLHIRTELASVGFRMGLWILWCLDYSSSSWVAMDLEIWQKWWCLRLGCKWQDDFCLVLAHLHLGGFPPPQQLNFYLSVSMERPMWLGMNLLINSWEVRSQ